MALISLLLGKKEIPVTGKDDSLKRKEYPVYRRDSGVKCPNSRCVSTQESEMKISKTSNSR